MISKSEIAYWIDELLSHLENIQNDDGSFDTMYMQPYYNPEKGWMHYAGNSPYETAFPLTILQKLQSTIAQKIVSKGTKYIKKKSLDNFLWTYAYPSKKDLVPYDTDSTSLCSLILSDQGFNMRNKEFIDSLINASGYYPFYIWPSKKEKSIPLLTYFKLKRWNNATKNSTNIINKILELEDSEFTSTCINLLYMGETHNNKVVWNTITQKIRNFDLDFLYYIDEFHALYHYARLVKYRNRQDLMLEDSILNKYIMQLKSELEIDSYSDKNILFLLILSLFNRDINDYTVYIDKFIDSLRKGSYKATTAFYSSNRKTDFQPNTLQPHTFFGSPAITCALYIEFLYLYSEYH